MKEAIQNALMPLRGQPLSDMWRYAGIQKFEFGIQRPYTNRKGEAITRADWGLVVTCEWHILGPDGEIVSSRDFGPSNERRDEKAFTFYDTLDVAPPMVENIIVDEQGGLCLVMTHGYKLIVLPNKNPDKEQWRLMPPEKLGHFVVTSTGIESQSL